MAERDHILTALVQELLGPREGPNEVLPANQDPRDEYITGILAPARTIRPPDDIDADIDEVIEETSSDEDQDTQGFVSAVGVFSPALAPQDLPRSIGLSFTVEAATGTPQIAVCVTWARYQQSTSGWQRQPAHILTGEIPGDQPRRWSVEPGISLQLRPRRLSDARWRVSLFLVNEIKVPDPKPPASAKIATADHLFQPQIRVCCSPGTVVVPTPISSTPDALPGSLAAEDASLALLYSDHTALARGHLCGAIWKAIDPERPHPTLPTPEMAPFAWTDAGQVSPEDRARFSPPHVRTDLLPSYPIETPQMQWEEQYGPAPVFDPRLLAETWDSEQVRASLQPLVDGYEKWINEQQGRLASAQFTLDQRNLASSHLQECQQAGSRIREAIEILATDPEARLAFCFANKAIALQSQWSRPGQVLMWRPFQLAFILLNIPALVSPLHPDRTICDLLWFPTGGGKTEAYLGLAAFTLALRRRRNYSTRLGAPGAGVGVLSRYTLRLLTIQQFRRALGLITACELLRVHNLNHPQGPVGWRPQGYPGNEPFLWGGARFAIGLWVGGNVTPNNQLSFGPLPTPPGFTVYLGALDILRGGGKNYHGLDPVLAKWAKEYRVEKSGDPAQVLNCPCCSAILAIPNEGLAAGQHTLHFVFQGGHPETPPPTEFYCASPPVRVDTVTLTKHSAGFRTLSLTFTVPENHILTASQIDDWWHNIICDTLGGNAELLAARPARPGYFILTYDNSRNRACECGFDIYCPSPTCPLNQQPWAEQVPLARAPRDSTPESPGHWSAGVEATSHSAPLPSIANLEWQEVPACFRLGKTRWVADRIPIPAFTVDDQIYHRCPSMVIATVDKFARLAFEPKAAALFGNVERYHARWGYYRPGCPPSWGNLPDDRQYDPPGQVKGNTLRVDVAAFLPPDLILQDELHLLDGPLGSMVGLYETAIDLLCQRRIKTQTAGPKYIASTATVRRAGPQVQALFNRRLAQFPQAALTADDRFFARDQVIHPLDSTDPGRLYVAVCAPGKGAQTPIVRIWSSLLQTVAERWAQNPGEEVDRFWTLVGYFNAIRELAGALSLYRQDIPERMAFRAAPAPARPLDEAHRLELSSRASSLDLPMLLERLNTSVPKADVQDAVFATSMFGTGVDIERLSLMVVHGQPKTSASYIQATGRVGRRGGGLIVTFFRASRPRDLDHYEFFTGYHCALYRHVEPVTVAPYSPGARTRGLGPLAVILLRQARSLAGHRVDSEWRIQQRLSGAYFARANLMATRRHADEVTAIPDLLEARSAAQPDGRRPPPAAASNEVASELDRWKALAVQHPGTDAFVYDEPAMIRLPIRSVVLGDPQHQLQGLDQAYENAPQSLREVEETTGFKS